jgi:hypothetical protein
MSDQALRGSCLCKAVRYEIRPPFLRFRHCYCSRCRKATGGVRATNIAVVVDQFRWTSGEELISRYDLPEAKSFARQICTRCNCPVPHKSRCTIGETVGTRALEQPGELGRDRRITSPMHGLSHRACLAMVISAMLPGGGDDHGVGLQPPDESPAAAKTDWTICEAWSWIVFK